MTREEAITELNTFKIGAKSELGKNALDMAIKALEQEPVIDKIRAKIVDTLYVDVDSLIFGELIDFKSGKIGADDVIREFHRVTRMEMLHIIDKYRTESEG